MWLLGRGLQSYLWCGQGEPWLDGGSYIAAPGIPWGGDTRETVPPAGESVAPGNAHAWRHPGGRGHLEPEFKVTRHEMQARSKFRSKVRLTPNSPTEVRGSLTLVEVQILLHAAEAILQALHACATD